MLPSAADKIGSDIVGSRTPASPEIVGIDILRGFPELVRQLGGDPSVILRRSSIDPALLDKPGAVIEYRHLLDALRHSADMLDCPEFGLKLAVVQGGNKSIGPLGVAMKNSKTLGQAMAYCAKHINAYSLATRLRLLPDRANHKLLVHFEILLDRMPDKRQAVEHALMLATLNIRELTDGGAQSHRIMFAHEAQISPRAYRQYFGCDVAFGQNVDGFVLTEDDLLAPVVNADSRVYEMATAFIEARFPHTEASIHARVRSFVRQYLGTKDCANEHIAAEFCLHPRTLQRRLRAEGTSFEEIKDEIRRELAIRFIQHSDMPLKRVAEKLGYAETSVLSRSCFRWFAVSPRQLRLQHKAAIAAGNATAACIGNVQQVQEAEV